MRTPFTGCGTALVTPFTATGALDEAGVRRLARRQIDARHPLPRAVRHDRRDADAVRAPSAAASSRSSSRRPRGRVPVLAGAGGYDTREVVEAGARDAGGRAPTACSR